MEPTNTEPIPHAEASASELLSYVAHLNQLETARTTLRLSLERLQETAEKQRAELREAFKLRLAADAWEAEKARLAAELRRSQDEVQQLRQKLGAEEELRARLAKAQEALELSRGEIERCGSILEDSHKSWEQEKAEARAQGQAAAQPAQAAPIAPAAAATVPAPAVDGAVAEVAAHVLDKQSQDKGMALEHIKVSDGGVDLTENSRWELWRPGADPRQDEPRMSGWASQEDAVPPGSWDLRISYDEGALCRYEGWIRGVDLQAGKVWEADVKLLAPMQHIRLGATVDGKDAGDEARIEVFKPGQDKPLNAFWSGKEEALAAGDYDLRVTLDKDGVKARAEVKGFHVGADHGLVQQAIALEKVAA